MLHIICASAGASTEQDTTSKEQTNTRAKQVLLSLRKFAGNQPRLANTAFLVATIKATCDFTMARLSLQ